MRITFPDVRIRETQKCKGDWVNLLKVLKNDGSTVYLDRDSTTWDYQSDVDEDGYFTTTMQWRCVYEWDGNETRYVEDGHAGDYVKALELEIEDDVEDGYDLMADLSSVEFS